MKKWAYKVLVAVAMLAMLFAGMQPAPAMASSFPTNFNLITPPNNNVDQLEYAIANNPQVQYKWADLANAMGFGWCGGQTYGAQNNITEGYVGQNFDVTSKGIGSANPSYTLTAHYIGDGGGYDDNDRLVMTLSNFRVLFDPSGNSFQWSNPKDVLGNPVIGSSEIAVNASNTADNFSKQYQYSVSGTVTHTTDFEFTEGMSLAEEVDVGVPDVSASKTTLTVSFSATQGWSDSTSTTTSQNIGDTYNAIIPADTQRTIEQETNYSTNSIDYSTNAEIIYDVSFSGFLKYGGNCEENLGRPQVTFNLGSAGNLGGHQNPLWGASDYIEDLYANNNITNYNQGSGGNINWSEVEGGVYYDGSTSLSSGYSASDVDSLVNQEIYGNPEGANVKGTFTYNGTTTDMTATDPTPLYRLGSLSATGAIPTLDVNDTYDLSQLTLAGNDVAGVPFYGLGSLPVTWKVLSGNAVSISGGTLTAVAPGTATVTASVTDTYVGGSGTVTSAPITVKVADLDQLSLTGSIPTIFPGGSFDLSKLTLAGQDQYGNSFGISGQPVTWKVATGGSYASITGSALSGVAPGSGTVTATVNGVTSTPIAFTVENPPALKTLTISNTLPPLYIGDQYDLSKLLTLTALDQYGEPYDISGQPVTWTIISGSNFASISGNILTTTYKGGVDIKATVQGVTTSNFADTTISDQPRLDAIALSGSLPTLYANGVCDLSQLFSATGQDQYGSSFNISGQPVTWKVATGWSYASIGSDGHTLTATAVGNGTITATVNGVTSTQIAFTVKSPPVLKTLNLSGAISSLYVGSTCDLSQQLTLSGIDQNGDPYSLAGQAVTWSIVSGNTFASISGSTLAAQIAGPVTIQATVQGIPTSPLSLTVYNLPELNDITATSSLPTLYTDDTCDLSQLVALAGTDQYKDSIDIKGLPVTWQITYGDGYASIAGSVLTATAPGSGTITATVYGMPSNPVDFTVKSPSVLMILTMTGSIPDIEIGQNRDLSQLLASKQLAFKAYDQNNALVSIAGQPVTWNIAPGGNCANITGSTLTAVGLGSGSITATVYGVTSNTVDFNAIAVPPSEALVINPDGGTYTAPRVVSITNIPAGDNAYFTTNGNISTVTDAVYYAAPFTLSSSATVIAAVYDPSTGQLISTVPANFTILLAPGISPNGGHSTTAQDVAITNPTPGDSVYYTLDGSTPKAVGSELYTEQFTLSHPATVTAKVYDQPTGLWSDPATARFTVLLTPAIDPADGTTFTTTQEVTITNPAPGDSVYYTLDGSTPKAIGSELYTAPFTISDSATVIAAVYDQPTELWSNLASATFTKSTGGGPSGGGGGGGGTTATTPTVQTDAATAITIDSATLNGDITSSGADPVTAYGFLYGSDQANLAGTMQVGTDNHSGSFAADLNNATEGTTYYYKAFATNTDGTSYGTVEQFTAAAAAPPVPAPALSFTDVPDSYWAHDAIYELSSQDYVNGYPDGTFKPGNQIIRAEFVTIMDKVLKLTSYTPQAPMFSDVNPDDWFYQGVDTAVYAGIAKGYGDGTFGSDRPITREEIACVLVQALGETDEAMASMSAKTNFTDDANISSWARGFVVVAVKDGLLKGYPDGSFGPQGDATRAEACVMIANFLNINK